MTRKPRDETRLAHLGRAPETHSGTVNMPVYRASTIVFETVEAMQQASRTRFAEKHVMHYGRLGTPTTFALEESVAELEGGAGAIAVSSGLAAVTTAMLAYARPGDHVLVSDVVYGPTRNFCERVLREIGVEVTYFDPLIGDGIEELFRGNTRYVYVESPGSLTFEVSDLPAIARAAHAREALVMLDNTWATPLYCKAFALGADISIHAATKYIVGHADAMLGIIVGTEANVAWLRQFAQILGQSCAPDNAYLGLRGLRTLSTRLERHHKNALELARWLRDREEVERVFCPALPGDSGHALWQRDFAGASGLFGVLLKPVSDEAVRALVESLEFFAMGYSWGGYESLILPARPEKSRMASTWSETAPLLRVHAGLEDVDDLKDDLDQGFARLRQAAASSA